eukprot:gnl/TRDRNA2_/TRDRNA2_180694_c0_seq1.p1 gnl/TRDRNA2_/TRDRNA2_180694_c0~~gnl/TRDRNA2_/TRDRNA2_180694_c0_seq1.p1  ORF type:complete len:466 (-),score=89.07 gnl/TRDRNA2_/TRDRNA2_180694_c0_seq1:152-1549(-)
MFRSECVLLCHIAALLFSAIAARAPASGETGLQISGVASLLQVVSHRSLDGRAIVADVAAGGRAAKGTRSIRALKRQQMRATAIARHNAVDSMAVPEKKAAAKRTGQLMRAEPASSSLLQTDGSMSYREAVALARTDQEEPEQIEEYKDSLSALPSSLDQNQLQNLVASINTQLYGAMLHKIADNQPSRFVAEAGNAKSAHLIEGMFKEHGLHTRMEPLDMSVFSKWMLKKGGGSDEGPLKNVIAVLPGTNLKNEAVIMGAHFDSVNWGNTAGKSPGVDDNGSGTAAVQLAAKLLTEYAKSHPPNRTIVFAAFNGEEEGLIGSNQFVLNALDHGTYGKMKYAVILDEVAWSGRNNTERSAIFETKGSVPGSSALLDTMHKCWNASTDHDGVKNVVVNKHGFGSDHMSFLDQGIPAVLLIERDDEYHSDEFGHSEKDTFAHVDLEFGASMTRLATRAVATLAWPAA